MHEESYNNESTSDVNNSKQSAICNIKDEQQSIHFIVLFYLRACRRVIMNPVFSLFLSLFFCRLFLYIHIFNHFVTNQQRDIFES